MTETCWIHIGMPKTGTKSLQKGMFYHHSEVDYLGLYIHDRKQFSDCRDADVQYVYRNFIFECAEEPSSTVCEKFQKNVIQPIHEANQRPVFSWESLIENNLNVKRQRARNLHRLFGHCKILVTLRHPLSLMQSIYLQLLRRDNAGQYARWGSPIRFESIDDWITRNWDKIGDAPHSHLEYPASIRVFAEEFGEENLEIRLYEQLKSEPEKYFQSICEAMGIDHEEGIQLTKEIRRNRRWTEQQYEFLQRVSASTWKRLLFQCSPRKIRQIFLGTSEPRYHLGERAYVPEISEDVRTRIKNHVSEGNRWIRDTWNVPLESYDYPL